MSALKRFVPLVAAVIATSALAASQGRTYQVEGTFDGCCMKVTAERLVIEGELCNCLDGVMTSVLQRAIVPGGIEVWFGEGQICTDKGFACTEDFLWVSPGHKPGLMNVFGVHSIRPGHGTDASGELFSWGWLNTNDDGLYLHLSGVITEGAGVPVTHPTPGQ